MIITLVMCALLLGGSIAWFAEGLKAQSARWISLLTVVLVGCYFVVSIITSGVDFTSLQLLSRHTWINSFNIEYALALDNLSITLVLLTIFLAIICCFTPSLFTTCFIK